MKNRKGARGIEKYIWQREAVNAICVEGARASDAKSRIYARAARVVDDLRPADVIPVAWIEAQPDHQKWAELVRRFRYVVTYG